MKKLLTSLITSTLITFVMSAHGEDLAKQVPSKTETAIPEKLKTDCLKLWQSRMPEGYKAIGHKYDLDTDLPRNRLLIEGSAKVSADLQYPFNFICSVNADLTLDRVVTYFAIRFDEQARNRNNPNGVFGNPVLPELNEEFKQ